jgi:hypothetical protein
MAAKGEYCGERMCCCNGFHGSALSYAQATEAEADEKMRAARKQLAKKRAVEKSLLVVATQLAEACSHAWCHYCMSDWTLKPKPFCIPLGPGPSNHHEGFSALASFRALKGIK